MIIKKMETTPYYRRTNEGIEEAVQRFCLYHAMMEPYIGQGIIKSSLDRGAFVRPHDVLPDDVLERFGPKRNSHSFAYGLEYGDTLLREKIAEFENCKHGTYYSAANIAIMPGAWKSIGFALMEIFQLKKGIKEKGHVAIIGPTLYQMFHYLDNSLGFNFVAYDFVDPEHEHIPQTVDDVANIFEEKPKAIIITNPTNPDGRYFPTMLLQHIIERAEAEKIYVLIDEIQNEFARRSQRNHGLSYGPWIQSPYVIRVDSPTKRYAIPEYRVGWVIADQRLLGDRTQGIVGRMSGSMGNAPRAANTGLLYLMEKEIEANRAGKELFQDKRTELEEKEQYVLDRLQHMGSVKKIFRRDACINLAVQFNFNGTDMQFAEALMKNGTLLMPASGYGYRTEDCVMRITFAERWKRLEHAMNTLERVLKR